MQKYFPAVLNWLLPQRLKLTQRRTELLLGARPIHLVKNTECMHKAHLRLYQQVINQLSKILFQVFIEVKLDFPSFFNVMIQFIHATLHVGPARFHLLQIISDHFFPVIDNPKRSVDFKLYLFINLSQSSNLVFKNLINQCRQIF